MPQRERGSIGQVLLQKRLALNWSQERLAEALGTTAMTVRRWEHNTACPQARFREQLCLLFHCSTQELFGSPTPEQSKPSPLWMVPFPRNPFFTGREEMLQQLHTQFHQEHTMALTSSWAINGLGGIGKTQIALEYAYRYRYDYRFVFWVNAAIRETCLADFLRIAELLQLPECREQKPEKVIRAVKQWLATHQGWLCILDNADDLTLLHDVIPGELLGHVLLTSRAQALGALASPIGVETMGLAEGTLFLLRRSRMLPSGTSLEHMAEEQLSAAEAIVLEMDFLPLALDQAGAYIEEVGCSFSDYLELYRRHRKDLLRRRGAVPTDHPEPVATTWSLSFQKVEQANPAAAELLRLCAFLEPDSIPEDLIRAGSASLGPVLGPVATNALALNKALEELRRFSLIHRSPQTRTLQTHRLVQAVLKDAMDANEQRQWAERVIRVINAIFPARVEMATWPDCRRFLSQAQICSNLIQEHALFFEEAAALLCRTATYLVIYTLYEQAEPLYQQALSIREQVLGPRHAGVAQVLEEWATLLRKQDRYAEAETLYRRAIDLWEQAHDHDPLALARGLHHLASLCEDQDERAQAEALYERALGLYEQVLGPEHLMIADPLLGLARLSQRQGQHEQAKQRYQRALQIREHTLGPDHLQVADPLMGLALLAQRQGQYAQAERLYQRALALREHALGPDHLEIAETLNKLASVLSMQGQFAQAEPFFRRALQIGERTLGSEHSQIAQLLHNLATLLIEQEQYAQAEPLCQRALRIWEQRLGPDHPNVRFALNSLAFLFVGQGKDALAEPLFRRALDIWEQRLGSEHLHLADPLNGLAILYREQGRYELAEGLFQRALSIREHALGPQHHLTAETLFDVALLQEALGNTQEAVSCCQRALVIREQIFGPQHPKTVVIRERLHALL